MYFARLAECFLKGVKADDAVVVPILVAKRPIEEEEELTWFFIHRRMFEPFRLHSPS